MIFFLLLQTLRHQNNLTSYMFSRKQHFNCFFVWQDSNFFLGTDLMPVKTESGVNNILFIMSRLHDSWLNFQAKFFQYSRASAVSLDSIPIVTNKFSIIRASWSNIWRVGVNGCYPYKLAYNFGVSVQYASNFCVLAAWNCF